MGVPGKERGKGEAEAEGQVKGLLGSSWDPGGWRGGLGVPRVQGTEAKEHFSNWL